MEAEVREHLERTEIDNLLSSGIFAKSPNLARMLNYICRKYWAGETDQIKEYNLAVEALGRPPDFDPSTSAIVRVEAHRLREKLRKYYDEDGAAHPVMVVLELGHYVPRFVRSSNQDLNSASRTSEANSVTIPSGPPALVPVENAISSAAVDGRNGHPQPLLPGAHANSRPARMILIAAFIVVAMAIGLILFLRARAREFAIPAASAPSSQTPVSVVGSPLSTVRIVSGYSRKNYVARSGATWSGDEYFHGGGTQQNPSHFVARTSDPTLFASDRHGEFSYDIPLKPGPYELWLYFDETMYGPGTILGGGETSRIFDVAVNGRVILSQFDVFADAGGDFIADERVFKNITPAADGMLHIRFLRRTQEPIVDAIKVIPMQDGKIQPIRIVAQDDSYTDHNGWKWNADRFYMDGRSVIRRGPVSGTLDPGLFDGERYGNFNYSIPVPAGRYALTLYFSERYFGPGKPGVGGAGSRVFNVICNGDTLLKHFDVFEAAGGADRALVKTFHNLTPNAQGKLELRFDPIVNYALVDAIQVTDESN